MSSIIKQYQMMYDKSYFKVIILTFIDQFIVIGREIGYIDKSVYDNLVEKFSILDISFDETVFEDIKVANNHLIINPKKLFMQFPDDISKSETYACRKVFFELIKMISYLHDDYEAKEKGIIYNQIIKVSQKEKLINRFNGQYLNFKTNDSKNYDNYAEYGLKLIDDVVAQYIVEQFVNNKYGTQRSVRYEFLNSPTIGYKTTLANYGLFEYIGELFSRNISAFKNLDDLSRSVFYPSIVVKIVDDFLDKPMSLYSQLQYMGVLSYSYDDEAKTTNSKGVSPLLFMEAYYTLLDMLKFNIKGSGDSIESSTTRK